MASPLIELIGDMEGLAARALSEASNAKAYAEEAERHARAVVRTLDGVRSMVFQQETEMFRLGQENARLLYEVGEAKSRSGDHALRLLG